MLTFLLFRCLFEIADLVIGSEGLQLMPFVDKVQCRDELLGKLVVLSAGARTSTEKSSRVSSYLVNCILQLSQSVTHGGGGAMRVARVMMILTSAVWCRDAMTPASLVGSSHGADYIRTLCAETVRARQPK